MDLNCEIINVNGNSFSNLDIKKLRQVIFFSDNRKEIQIYTAILVAANNQAINNQGTNKDDRLISELNNKFRLQVKFSTDKGQNVKITSQDCIKSFYEEFDKIAAVWGPECRNIMKQQDLNNQLEKILGKNSVDSSKTNIEDGNGYFCIEDKKDEKKTIVAYQGKIDEQKEGYTIQAADSIHKGVDCITWVKTTLTFENKMPPRISINAKILLPESDTITLSYISIYICPSEGYHLGNDSKVNASIGNTYIKSSADEYNNLSEANHNDDFYYDEWVQDLHIKRRTIYRLNREKLFKNQGNQIKNCKLITIDCHMGPVTEKGSQQFVLGALFSAAVTYGVDSGRLEEVSHSFMPFIPNDLQWFAFCFIIFWVFIRWCSRKYNVNSEGGKEKGWDTVSIWFLIGGIIASGLWTIFTFVVSRLDFAETSKIKKLFDEIWIFTGPWMLGIGLLLLIVYIVISYTIIKNNYGRKPISRELFY